MKCQDPSEYPLAGGIVLQIQDQKGVKIFNNTISDLYVGIHSYFSDNNIISNNSIFNVAIGIKLETCINNTLFNNHIYAKGEQEDFSFGISSETSSYNNFILNNTISNLRGRALRFLQSSNNLISSNLLINNLNDGIFLLMNSNNNSFIHNKAINNTFCGISISEDSGNNTIKFNDFIDNNNGNSQAADLGFNNLFIFNFWNEWTSPDINADGFVDNPYYIDNSVDNYDSYPLVHANPAQTHLLLPPVLLSPNGRESFTLNMVIQWVTSTDSFDHPISYSLYISKQNGDSWTLIETNITKAIFEWNIASSEFDSTNCLVKIVASCGLLSAEDTSDAIFTIDFPSTNSDENLIQLLFLVGLSLALIAGIIIYNLKFKVPAPFFEYFQSDQIEFLRMIYHKVVIGIENLKVGIIPELATQPLLEPQTIIEILDTSERFSLIPYFPSDIQEILKTIKGRTALVLIEMAYQDIHETNPTKLSQSLNIPPTTISDEIKRLVKLEFIKSQIKPSFIQDARFRYYNITSKGSSFLTSLKGALEVSINRLKMKEEKNV
jgi:parallel beta-helix repeat protein